MSKTVILAEKPDQAKSYVKALGKEKETVKNAYTIVDTDIFEGETIVTWGYGHLIELDMPQDYEGIEKNFSYDNLPILPDKMKYHVEKGKEFQFKMVKQQLESADLIVIATDPDREGENIAYLILNACHSKVWNIPRKRLWANTMNAKGLQKFFRELRDGKETYNQYKEANTRQIADWLVGMNFTQLMTLKAQQAGLKGLYSVGRVQTPTNRLVCENYLQIRKFKPEPYAIFEGIHQDDNRKVIFKNKEKYFDKEKLKETINNHSLSNLSEAKVQTVEKKEKRKKSPKLFDLSGIQTYCSVKFGWSLDKTADLVQSLYSKGYLSYPRTDSDLITTNEFEYLKSNVDKYKELLAIEFENENLEPRKHYVNNDKVLEHYAIIPTEEIPDLEEFSKDEKTLYKAVATNTVLMFAPDYVYESTKVIVNANDIEFQVNGTVPKSLGWKAIEESDTSEESTDNDEQNNELPAYTEGETIPFKVEVKKKETKPPRQLTEASLGGKTGLMKKLGIGTPATRSEIVKKLIENEYIEVSKTKLQPTVKGLLLYEMTKDIDIGKVEMTQSWEEKLALIGKGKMKQQEFLTDIHSFIENLLDSLKEKELEGSLVKQVANRNKDIIGNYLVEKINGKKGVFYSIKDKKTEEQLFTISNTILGKQLPKSAIKDLLLKGKTSKKVKGFKSPTKKDKDGKPKKFDCHLVLKNNRVEFDY